MLNPSCERFRTLYEPHRGAPGEPDSNLESHRRECADCASWAERLEGLTAAEARVPLPENLRRRLLAIPEEKVGCGDVERLYRAAWQRARTGEAEPEAAAHLAACARCRPIYATLTASFRTLRRPLPRALASRLRAITERPRLPLLVRDGRLALAASALLTASVLLLVGDPTPLVKETAAKMSSQATVMAEMSEERRQALFEAVSAEVGARYERGREKLRDRGHSYGRWWQEARDYYQNQKWRQLFASPTLEGERDGES